MSKIKFIAGAVLGGVATFKALSTQFGITRLRDIRSGKIARKQIKKYGIRNRIV